MKTIPTFFIAVTALATHFSAAQEETDQQFLNFFESIAEEIGGLFSTRAGGQRKMTTPTFRNPGDERILDQLELERNRPLLYRQSPPRQRRSPRIDLDLFIVTDFVRQSGITIEEVQGFATDRRKIQALASRVSLRPEDHLIRNRQREFVANLDPNNWIHSAIFVFDFDEVFTRIDGCEEVRWKFKRKNRSHQPSGVVNSPLLGGSSQRIDVQNAAYLSPLHGGHWTLEVAAYTGNRDFIDSWVWEFFIR